jgi:hypothetical protein
VIDPIHSLAFSLQANPGVYAVLLGSGVSRSARIPTGWEITIDLVRKLAQVSGEDCSPAPAVWYEAKYGKVADYSDLLDALAKSPAERQQLLRAYLEPSEAEREEGAKAPTPAHRSIAELAAKGYIRVIITTNFDRLMETALADAGVVPSVVSSVDQLLGAMPLIHTRCCVVKIHGDYLDTRIRNTPDELASYPAELNQLLDRIFDEFGLIFCGWSADWDVALRAAITRTASRRFSHYWCIRGALGEGAAELIRHRQAQTLQITDADGFFGEVARLVTALEQFSRPHPLSKEAAVASLKSYLSEQKHRIKLADLVDSEVAKILEACGGPALSLKGAPQPDGATLTTRVRRYEAACETLMSMAMVGGYWSEDWHWPIWSRALSRLSVRREDAGYTLWLELQRYPATLLLFSLGIGAVQSGGNGLKFLGHLLATNIHREHREDQTAAQLLPPFCLFERGSEPVKLLEGMDRRYAPLNDWVHSLLWRAGGRQFSSEATFDLAFDRLEVLFALSSAYHSKRNGEWYWAPPGCYGYRHENRERIVTEIGSSIDAEGDSSAYVISGLFGRSSADCKAQLGYFVEFCKKIGRSWW